MNNNEPRELKNADVKTIIQDIALTKHAPFTIEEKARGARYTYYKEIDNLIYLEIKADKDIKKYIAEIHEKLKNTNFRIERYTYNEADVSASLVIKDFFK